LAAPRVDVSMRTGSSGRPSPTIAASSGPALGLTTRNGNGVFGAAVGTAPNFRPLVQRTPQNSKNIPVTLPGVSNRWFRWVTGRPRAGRLSAPQPARASRLGPPKNPGSGSAGRCDFRGSPGPQAARRATKTTTPVTPGWSAATGNGGGSRGKFHSSRSTLAQCGAGGSTTKIRGPPNWRGNPQSAGRRRGPRSRSRTDVGRLPCAVAERRINNRCPGVTVGRSLFTAGISGLDQQRRRPLVGPVRSTSTDPTNSPRFIASSSPPGSCFSQRWPALTNSSNNPQNRPAGVGALKLR